ncbi:MAG: HAD family phosphatase [Zestosphaera sp.]
MIKGVVFDLDGTLADTVDLHVSTWIEACRRLDIPVDEKFVRGLVGLSAEDIARKLVNEETQALRLARLKRRLYLTRVDEVRLYPEVPEVLECLKRVHSLRLAVASSTNVETIEAVLNAKGIRDFFDSVVGSDLVSRGKPDPEIFLSALRMINVNPANAIIVGDTEYDVMPANALGAVSVLICREECRKVDVRPQHVIKDLRELAGLIASYR